MKNLLGAMIAVAGVAMSADAAKVEDFDARMAIEKIVVTNGVKWIDGEMLPIEGRWTASRTKAYYQRLPDDVSANVNEGVRWMKSHTSGMQFRFSTDSKRLEFRWSVTDGNLAMDHMPATGVSGIDVYRFDEEARTWRYVKTGRIHSAKDARLNIPWNPGDKCIVNLPLYNGIRKFALGIDAQAEVKPLGPRASGIDKPVVFYGTSITHGGCASRPGLGFVNIIGRELDVPVYNLGFSGSGRMELEMSEHLSKIDASCYVLDCLWNMSDRETVERYEPFIRNLRRLRPDVPIVMAERCDVYGRGPNAQDRHIRGLFAKLLAEGWQHLVYLPKDGMFGADGEGTVDGVHPNDHGMRMLATAFGRAVKQAILPPKALSVEEPLVPRKDLPNAMPHFGQRKLDGLAWQKVESGQVEGLGWQELEQPFDRMPLKAKEVPALAGIWGLGNSPTGEYLDFESDTSAVAVRCEFGGGQFGEANFNSTAYSGCDLYVYDENERKWKWSAAAQHFVKWEKVTEYALVWNLPAGKRRFRLYLPMRNRLLKLELGTDSKAVTRILPRSGKKPIAYYGTSIIHGAFVTRAGLALTSRLGRAVDRPFLNLGFSGAARLEPEMAELLAELDPAAFVCDPYHNCSADVIAARMEKFFDILCTRRPKTPVILVSAPPVVNDWQLPSADAYDHRRTRLFDEIGSRLAAKYANFRYIQGEGFYGDTDEISVDGIHPNDEAFANMTKYLAPLLNFK